MRRALVVAAAAALAALPASASSSGPTCSGACAVDAAGIGGYTPPVLVVPSGSNVTWHSTDINHSTRETATPLGSSAPCFVAVSTPSADSPAVEFDITNGALTATIGSVTRTCTNAVPLAGEGFALAYHCQLHPQMRGVLVVTTAS